MSGICALAGNFPVTQKVPGSSVLPQASLHGSRILSTATQGNSVETEPDFHPSTLLRKGPLTKGPEGMRYVPSPFYHHRWPSPTPNPLILRRALPEDVSLAATAGVAGLWTGPD